MTDNNALCTFYLHRNVVVNRNNIITIELLYVHVIKFIQVDNCRFREEINR